VCTLEHEETKRRRDEETKSNTRREDSFVGEELLFEWRQVLEPFQDHDARQQISKTFSREASDGTAVVERMDSSKFDSLHFQSKKKKKKRER